MNMPWHIGIAVPDLTKGLEEFSDLFGVTWRPVHEVPLHLTDENGHPHDVTIRVTFSLTSPFALEVWEAIPRRCGREWRRSQKMQSHSARLTCMCHSERGYVVPFGGVSRAS